MIIIQDNSIVYIYIYIHTHTILYHYLIYTFGDNEEGGTPRVSERAAAAAAPARAGAATSRHLTKNCSSSRNC